jgi:zinc transporter 2
MKKLFFVSCICFFFMICEFIGGLYSHSLAIMVDAAHMFSDVAGFMISFFAIYISQRKATFNNSYGYHRSEILGAILSIFVIWGLLVWLNIEAVARMIDPPKNINADVMLITAIIGLICNIVNFCALNCACGSDAAENEITEHVSESEHDDWTIENKSKVH